MGHKRKAAMTAKEYDQAVVYHHFPTPSQFVRHACMYLMRAQPFLFQRAMWERPLRILDHSCGTGVWNAVWSELIPESYRVNVELQVAEPLRPETAQEWHYGVRFQDWTRSYLQRHAEDPLTCPLFDVISGNPPFKEGESFVRCGYQLLAHDGVTLNLLPIPFLSTQERTRDLHRPLPPLRIVNVPKRISFSKNGRTDEREYILLLHKRNVLPQFSQYDFGFDWDYDMPDIPEDLPFDSWTPEQQWSMFDLVNPEVVRESDLGWYGFDPEGESSEDRTTT